MPSYAQLAAMAVLAASAPLSAQQITSVEATSEHAPIDSTTQADSLQFKSDATERMTVPVRVAGAGPFRFLVDTGADRTAISRDLARQLKLAAGQDARMHSVTGADMIGTAQVPLLELGERKVHLVDAALLERRHMGADGILGVDSLRSQRITFDFKANTLSVVPSAASRAPIEPDTIVVRAKTRKGHLILTEARINGLRVNVVIDTGAQFSIGNEALRSLLRINTRQADQVPLMSVSGDTMVSQMAMLRKLDIGGAVLKDLPIVFADAHTFRKLQLDRRPTLLLGMNAIKAFDKVSIDFAQKKMRVVLPESSSIDGYMLAERRAP